MAKKLKTGRKRINPAEKVILVGFYTRKKNVEELGGMENTRERAKVYIEALTENAGK